MSRGIAYVTYDGNSNPSWIYFTNGNATKYVYSAAGEKLKVVHYTAWPNITRPFGVQPTGLNLSQVMYRDSTDYFLGGSLVVKNGAIDKILFDGGYAQVTSGGSTSSSFTFFYYNKDHLGNNREVTNMRAGVKQVTNYYPSGAPFVESSTSSNPDCQPYKYNGKELDRMHGLDTYDYGARQYYSILGRWDRMDPLCEKYYSISPYVYCGNNPVRFIDEHGDSTAVLNMGYGPTNKHIALLIQNDKNEWQYYSFNGVPVYNMTNGLVGGGPHDNMGEKSFVSPQEFLDSEYNTYEGHPKVKMSRDEINGYGYHEAYVLPTTQEQDKIIRESFENAVLKGYNLFTNHCGHAVQNALKSAGFGVSITSFEKDSFTFEGKEPYLPGNAFMYVKANNIGESLYRRK